MSRSRETDQHPTTFKAVARRYMNMHVEKNKFISRSEIQRQLDCYVYPAWADEPISNIGQTQVVQLISKIAAKQAGDTSDKGGSVMAERVLATLRSLFKWYEAQDRKYISPVRRGMSATPSTKPCNSDILADDEVSALWADWSSAGAFGAFLQTCLLTAQQPGKVRTMRWSDIDDGVWTIGHPSGGVGDMRAIKLPRLAYDLIQKQPTVGGDPHVFAGLGTMSKGNINLLKQSMDERAVIARSWTISDVRRTARSLHARAMAIWRREEQLRPNATSTNETSHYRENDPVPLEFHLEALSRLVECLVHQDADGAI